MKTAVKVRMGHKLVTFHKSGTKASLCKVTKIKIKGKTFYGRRGGRTLCGQSTGKNSPNAKAARAAFKRMVKHHRRVVRRVVRRHRRHGRRR